MSSLANNETSIGLFAVPLEIEGVGADRVLPPVTSTDGARLLIPKWPNPSVIIGNSDLLEIWVTEPGANIETLFYSNPFPVPVTIPNFFLLPAQYLQRNGNIDLKYRVTQGDSGNEDTSLPQTFIVRRPVPVNLEEPTFPNTTLWGYLNCSSSPKVWEAVHIKAPVQPGRFSLGDECVLGWEGFDSLNGVRPIPGTALQVSKTLTKTDVEEGPLFVLGNDKYEQYIKPIQYGSALAHYTLFRNGIALGKSAVGLLKIDRTLPGQPPCGPVLARGLGSIVVDDALDDIESGKALVPEACSLSSHDCLLGIDVDCSMNHSPMEFSKMNMPVKDAIGVLAVTPIIVGQLADRRLTYKQLREDRLIKVELSDVADKSDLGAARIDLHVFPKGTVINEFDPTFIVATKLKVDQSGGDWTFPVTFDVPVDTLIEKFHAAGDYTAYEFAFVIHDVPGNVDTSSPYAEALIDLTAPHQRQPGGPNGTGNRPTLLTLGTTVPAIINDAWLNDPANAGGLNLNVPNTYQKFEAGNDVVNFYISQLTTFTLMQGETPAFSGPLPADGVINIPLSFLQNLAEGTYYYSYNLTDLPGSISNNAAITTLLQRVVTPAPILDAPRIPVTGPTGAIAINLTTVNPPPSKVIMETDHPINSIENDRVIPYMSSSQGIFEVNEQTIPPAGTPGPLKFSLDYDFFSLVFGDANGLDEVEFEYWFELGRPTINPNPVSPPAFGIIDFAYAGPEQPNLPDLENPNIVPVVVQGAGTPVPNPNTLTPAQAGIAAEMIWPIWSDPARPVSGREIVTFFYQGKQVGNPVPVRIGDTSVRTALSWATILAEGNGTGANAREAYITIEFPGSANKMKQLITTKVDVTAIVINLPVPRIVVSAFRGPTGNLIPERFITSISCPAFNHPVVPNGPMPPFQPRSLRIRIERDANIPTGAMVNLNFEGRVTNAVGAAPIPGTLITRSAPMPATGPLEFNLTEYNPQIRTIQLPSPDGKTRPAARYARIAYTVNGITSEVTVAVQILNASLVYCELERPEVSP
ncbi:hypothetical protein [Pseudomonas sp. fls2-241-R2A-110]|uniref:hypothetical protein n=1 Tax=Pseudomonas sp. fls2-241-R2A-110 TaxID=3040311 RepID=UPI0025549C44|nr:hypothetical protein [Pseudomonas sp. fls2-241-R2A-110]